MHTLLVTTLVLTATLGWSHLGRTMTTLTLIILALRGTRPAQRTEILTSLGPTLASLVSQTAPTRSFPPRTEAHGYSDTAP